jgi:hypothetical protein
MRRGRAADAPVRIAPTVAAVAAAPPPAATNIAAPTICCGKGRVLTGLDRGRAPPTRSIVSEAALQFDWRAGQPTAAAFARKLRAGRA